MKVTTLEPLLAEHEFFSDFNESDRELLAGCAANTSFRADESILREGGAADYFYLLRFGKVAIEYFAPGRGSVTIQTLGEGDVLGWSWLFPPYRSHYDARALEVTRALRFDGACLRGKCDADPELGYRVMKRFSQVVVERLSATQMQLMDLYGVGENV